jgi:hypothetical protein
LRPIPRKFLHAAHQQFGFKRVAPDEELAEFMRHDGFNGGYRGAHAFADTGDSLVGGKL